jgi:hypothetical protein
MALNDPLNNRESNTTALKPRASVESLENAEKFFRIPHVETSSVVANKIDRLVALLASAYFYESLHLLPRELKSIREQIHEHLFEQSRVAATFTEVANAHLDLPIALLPAEFIDDFVNESRKINSLFGRRLASELGEIQQSFD